MSPVLFRIYLGLNYFATILNGLLFAYAILSWITLPTNRLYVFVSNLVSPILTPFRPIARKLLEAGFRIDMSVILAWISIRIIMSILSKLLLAF